MKRYSWYHGHLRLAHVGVKRRVLITVQNLPVPFGRRAWLECQALVLAGYRVAVVCSQGSGDPACAFIDTVELYKYQPYTPGGSKLSFVTEYARNWCKEHRLRLTRTFLAKFELGAR